MSTGQKNIVSALFILTIVLSLSSCESGFWSCDDSDFYGSFSHVSAKNNFSLELNESGRATLIDNNDGKKLELNWEYNRSNNQIFLHVVGEAKTYVDRLRFGSKVLTRDSYVGLKYVCGIKGVSEISFGIERAGATFKRIKN